MKRISNTVWRYHDAFGSTSYLVTGETRAVMIDCSMETGPIMPRIRAITDLQVDLLLTHAHPDHYGAAGEFERIWLNEKDAQALDEMEPVFACMGVPPLPRERIRTFGDGQVFDLGGAKLMAAELTGHTPGSTVFVYEKEKAIFSGDAVGSGDIVLMAVPKAFDLRAYRQSILSFLERSAPWADYVWYAGHWHQAQRGEGMERNDPCRALLEDMAKLCEEIFSERIVGEEQSEAFAPDGTARKACLGKAGIVYCDQK